MGREPAHGFYSGDEWKEGQATEEGNSSVGLMVIVGLLAVAGGFIVFADRPQPQALPDAPGVLSQGAPSHDERRSQLLQQGAELLQANQLHEAEQVYRKILLLYPDDPDSHSNLAACHYFQEDYAEAEEQYRAALKLAPNDARALYGLGCVHYELERYGSAQQSLERALKLGHDRSLTCWTLALLADDTGQGLEARRYYEEYLKVRPEGRHVDHARRRLAALGEAR